jgi:hypothetical protein
MPRIKMNNTQQFENALYVMGEEYSVSDKVAAQLEGEYTIIEGSEKKEVKEREDKSFKSEKKVSK